MEDHRSKARLEGRSHVHYHGLHSPCVHIIREREFFIDNLLVRIEMTLVDRPCAMGV
jgi:hypothetical protein